MGKRNSVLKNNFYVYDKAAGLNEILPLKFVDTIGLENKQMVDDKFPRGTKVRRRFMQRVFVEFLNLMLNDAIDNNTKFISPSRYWFSIYIREKGKKDMGRIGRNSKIYGDVDFIESDGKVYEFVFQSPYLPKGKYRSIRIGWTMYQKLVKKVNEGMRYFIR
jgi:hypothetical protein